MNKIPTTLCYLEKDGRYLMLHRTKKEKRHEPRQSTSAWAAIWNRANPRRNASCGSSGGNRLYADPLSAAGRDYLRH